MLIHYSSDTTSATLTWLFYELCKNPSALRKLQGIVDGIAPGKSFLDAEDLTNCPHLDGVIHEAMRLHPAVSTSFTHPTKYLAREDITRSAQFLTSTPHICESLTAT